jgi:hypothetical protein
MEDMDWTDKRPLDKLTFGIALPEAERAEAADRVRVMLTDLGVKIAEDIKSIGCTTLAARAANAHGTNGEMIGKAIVGGRFLRMALGGSGIGLTCYVPPTRYCHVHDTIGGLQENQDALYPEMVDRISRELTDEERVKFRLVEHVRHMEEETTDKVRAAVLSGRRLPSEFAPEDDAVGPGAGPVITSGSHDAAPAEPVVVRAVPTAAAWLCPEHDEFVVACRYCLAESIIKGPLQPAAILVWGEGTEDDMEQLPLIEVADKVAALDKSGEEVVALYVKAVRWTRRLARE